MSRGDCTAVAAQTRATIEGPVGNEACLGDFACRENTGTVGDGSCVGFEACAFNSGTIGPGQCVGFQICKGNDQDIP